MNSTRGSVVPLAMFIIITKINHYRINEWKETFAFCYHLVTVMRLTLHLVRPPLKQHNYPEEASILSIFQSRENESTSTLIEFSEV